jgi:SAM-dependent methyltransferase
MSEQELINIYCISTDRASDPSASYAPLYDKRLSLLAQLTENSALTHVSGRKVLEVGCSNGAMLHQWGGNWEKFGIEPSRASAEIAQDRGINILGQTLSDIGDGKWDCIISVDTIEHLHDPLEFFKHAKNFLSPGGVILTLTGDASFWLAGIAGPRYWYASFPEHISFVSPPCMHFIASSLNGRVLQSTKYQWGLPGKSNHMQWLVQSVKFGGLAIALTSSMIPVGKNLSIKRGFPVMTAHKDHFLNVMGCFE